MLKCRCGKHLNGTPEHKKVKIELSNPGTVEFDAKAVECECGELVFSEEDMESVLHSFEQSYKHKNKK